MVELLFPRHPKARIWKTCLYTLEVLVWGVLRLVKECVGSLTCWLIYNTTVLGLCQPPSTDILEFYPRLDWDTCVLDPFLSAKPISILRQPHAWVWEHGISVHLCSIDSLAYYKKRPYPVYRVKSFLSVIELGFVLVSTYHHLVHHHHQYFPLVQNEL